MLRERAQTASKTGIDRKCKEIMGKIINPAAQVSLYRRVMAGLKPSGLKVKIR